MRKNKIIEILQKIKGNPEVVVWNGFVDDWMGIDEIKPVVLTRLSNKKKLEIVNYQRINQFNLKPFSNVKQLQKLDEWKVDDGFYNEFDDLKKTVLLIEQKLKGKSQPGYHQQPKMEY